MTRIPHMSDVAHYPYPVTEDMLKSAMERLEERNKKVLQTLGASCSL